MERQEIENLLFAVGRGLFGCIFLVCFLAVLFIYFFPKYSDPMEDSERLICHVVGSGIWLISIVFGVYEGSRYWKKKNK